jgi:DNA-directed RNA polymerase specialized sigma24 family protein
MTPARNRLASPTADDPNAAVLAELRTMNRLLAAFTTRDMEPQKAIIFLDGAGFGAAQIAAVLGINPVTVRTTLFRARKAAEKNNAKVKPDAGAGTADGTRPTDDADAGDANGNA